MKVITLLNEKGGVGKTTLATHIAAGLAIKGHRVVLVDTDAQGNATMAFGLPQEPGFYDLLVRKASFTDVLRRIPPERFVVPDAVPDVSGELYLIPSNVESRNIANSMDDAFAVMRRFQTLKDAGIDYVIFDTSPTPSLLHGSIYMATDAICYPTKCEPWSFAGLMSGIAHKDQFAEYRQRYQLTEIEILAIVPMMYRNKTLEHQENLAKLSRAFREKVWEPLSLRTMWSETSGAKRMIWAYQPRSVAAEEMWNIVSRVEAHYVKS